jgi:transglutaminase-like putative cysteine protease
MQLEVIHHTHYDYQPMVEQAQHIAFLKPMHDDASGQTVLTHSLLIEPTPDTQRNQTDVWGNARCHFALASAHTRLDVTAHSVVCTAEAPVAPAAAGWPWERLREHLTYRRGGAFDAASEFAHASPLIARLSEFAQYGHADFEPGRPVDDAARALMSRVHRDMTYDSGSTAVDTPVLTALHARRGVCQDFAHIMVATLRSLGLAARYVSGYLLTQPPPGQPRLVGADASHAWVQVYVPSGPGHDDPQGRWLDLDPTNDREAGPDYVRLAVGRDYSDVPPLRGVIHGGGQHALSVAVTVRPI